MMRLKEVSKWLMLIIGCVSVCCLSSCTNHQSPSSQVSSAITVTDDDGNTVSLSKPAQRIITLSPHATELVYDIGAGTQVIATTRFSDYPEAAKALPTVGDVHQLDIEKIISLKPDLIVLWPSGNTAKQLAVLEQTGIPIYRTHPKNFEDIPDSQLKLGQLTGHLQEAQERAQQWRDRYHAIQQQYQHRSRISVFYQVFDRPIYTIGGKQLINDAISLCGGQNIFSDVQMPAPTVDIEAVLGRNPDAIISAGGVSSDNGLGVWKAVPAMKAVKTDNLYTIPADLISRPGPRMIQGIQYLCEDIEKARKKLENK